MLFSPESHEPLLLDAWSTNAIEGAIREIVADAEAAFDDGWPTHPQDGDEPRRFRTVYLGGAGVVRALDELQRCGLVELRRDYVPYLEREYVADFPEYDHEERSLLMGETGIRLVLQWVAPSTANADRLAELIAANVRDERRELMWGSPGTMLAAARLHRETGERRWDDLWKRSAAWLEGEWDPESGVWTQELYGNARRFLGPAHGFAGCVLALAAGPTAADLHQRAAAVTRRYAVAEDGLANWPALADAELTATGDRQIRVQWCHGAPGMVASLAALAPDDPEHDRLLRAGGELVWHAGPLTKGANLCHGTAGNGYAFLALLERTGDELWLDRARAFAMHAAAQVTRDRARYGRGRFTLWTGDPGTALYLADCLAGRGAFPVP
ncbi:MAG: lanthionine synthetase [Thermoleophilia bacterium]|nr:lanthionine synthetase [Thermoleophilia bacterium]